MSSTRQRETSDQLSQRCSDFPHLVVHHDLFGGIFVPAFRLKNVVVKDLNATSINHPRSPQIFVHSRALHNT
jgi:hypothetical protein